MDFRCQYSPSLRVAITGATGFIGKNLIGVFASDDFECCVIEEVPDGATIIHLAADVSPTREALLENAACDTFLVELANQKHRGLVYASGNNVYPFAVECRVSEYPRANDYYALSKILGEKLVSEWARIPSVTVRIADVFGGGQRHGNFFKAIEHSVRTGGPLQQYGKGLKRRTYIHVRELCEMLKFISQHCLECVRPGGEVLNLGYADSASVAEILQIVSELTGVEILARTLDSDRSEFDVRTMFISPLNGYVPCWGGFREALTAYVEQIQKGS